MIDWVNTQRNEQYTQWRNVIESLIKKQNQMINEDLSDIDKRDVPS